MQPTAYQRFIDHLVAQAQREAEIVGVVLLGSTAGRKREPDSFSDHDVWVVTVDGAAAALRDDSSWLPDPERIVGHFYETQHGRSVVYDDGHLLELAVFDDGELEVAAANDYRVVYDSGRIEERMVAIAERTKQQHHSQSSEVAAGAFVTHVIIGLGRYGRGELLSAGERLRSAAVTSLLQLVTTGTGSLPADNLDPLRRFEAVDPALAARLDAALARPLPDLAASLLDLAADHGDAFPDAVEPALAAASVALERARRARPAAPWLHHVQLAIPAGGEDAARNFYTGVLGIPEVAKPAALAARGGCWFRIGTLEIHLGVEEPFRPAAKAHPGIRVGKLDELAGRLEAVGHSVRWDGHFPGHRRFYTDDPFGNRLEFLQAQTR